MVTEADPGRECPRLMIARTTAATRAGRADAPREFRCPCTSPETR
jgi:hypothetical protein